jgi:hypothetical protein
MVAYPFSLRMTALRQRHDMPPTSGHHQLSGITPTQYLDPQADPASGEALSGQLALEFALLSLYVMPALGASTALIHLALLA